MSASPSITALLVLGRYAYAVSETELIPLSTAADGLTPQQALERWLDDESPKVRSPIPIVWEPHGDTALHHDRFEVPARISRAEFAGAEDVLRRYPALAHGTHAWSYEPLPKNVPSGKVFVHIETVPGIQLFGETAMAQGVPVSAVWALPTVAFNGFGRGIGVKVLALAPGFCGVYTVPPSGGPTKGMVSVVDTTHPQVARSLYPVLEKEGFFASEQAPKAWRIVGTKEELLKLAPVLAAADPKVEAFITNAAAVVPIKSWAGFVAENTRRLPRGGEQDMWASFPQPFPLGKVLRAATIASVILAAVFAVQARLAVKDATGYVLAHASVEKAKDAQLAKARADLVLFKQNRAELAGKDASTGAPIPRGRAALLQVLHDKVGEDYTLTSLTVAADGAVTAELFQVTDGPETPQNITALKTDLQRAGFGNCTIQGVTSPPDRENAPGLSTKHHYQITAQYAPGV